MKSVILGMVFLFLLGGMCSAEDLGFLTLTETIAADSSDSGAAFFDTVISTTIDVSKFENMSWHYEVKDMDTNWVNDTLLFQVQTSTSRYPETWISVGEPEGTDTLLIGATDVERTARRIIPGDSVLSFIRVLVIKSKPALSGANAQAMAGNSYTTTIVPHLLRKYK